MSCALVIHKAHGDKKLLVALAVQAVDVALGKERESRNGVGDGVRNAGFAAPVAAGDDRGISESQLRRLRERLEARKAHARDLKTAYLFHLISFPA